MNPTPTSALQGLVIFLLALSLSGTLFLFALPIALVLLLTFLGGSIVAGIRQTFVHLRTLMTTRDERVTRPAQAHKIMGWPTGPMSWQAGTPSHLRRRWSRNPALQAQSLLQKQHGHSLASKTDPFTNRHTTAHHSLLKPLSLQRNTTVWIHHTQAHLRRTHHAG